MYDLRLFFNVTLKVKDLPIELEGRSKEKNKNNNDENADFHTRLRRAILATQGHLING